jgi:hypothetical protein
MTTLRTIAIVSALCVALSGVWVVATRHTRSLTRPEQVARSALKLIGSHTSTTIFDEFRKGNTPVVEECIKQSVIEYPLTDDLFADGARFFVSKGPAEWVWNGTPSVKPTYCAALERPANGFYCKIVIYLDSTGEAKIEMGQRFDASRIVDFEELTRESISAGPAR